HMMRFGAIVAAGAAAWLGATPGHELFEQLGRRSNPSLLGLRPVRANDVPTVPAVQRSSMAFSGKACHLYTVASQAPGYSFGGTIPGPALSLSISAESKESNGAWSILSRQV